MRCCYCCCIIQAKSLAVYLPNQKTCENYFDSLSIVLSSSSLILSSPCSNLPLNPSSDFFFFISFILLFSSRISFRFLFRYSICWYFHFVHNIIFLTSSTSSFSSLSIYKEVILKSLVYLSSGLFQGQFLLIFNFFFHLNGSYFPVYLYA